ncbi:MAG TPA: ribosome-binding factor A [Acidimicrobiales bacterium]|nr:ribosome-binding factor A [Acidimicrobiales bacterium]
MTPAARRHPSGSQRYPRVYRVNQLVREVLADELERLADSDERLGLLTITGVTTEPDLRHATVFLSSLSEEAREGLNQHRAALQASLAGQIRLKRTPRLSFEADPGVATGTAIDDLIRRIHSGEAGDAEADAR